ncbi:MAG: hypothetical protein AAF598_05370 [Bacteroidota bacterium]
MKYFLSLLGLLLLMQGYAQDSLLTNKNFQSLFSIEGEHRHFTTDVLQNLYLIDEEGVMHKYTANGELQYSYNDFQLGEPTLIDATNPFRLLLFYPDYLTIVSLDNTLSKTGEYDLYNLDFSFIETIAFSNSGNLWVYDPDAFQVKKIDRNLEPLLASNELSFLLDQGLMPKLMIERNNWLYVNDPELGILIFDVYGQYSRNLSIMNLEWFQVFRDQILYVKGDKYLSFDTRTLVTRPLSLPRDILPSSKIQLQQDRMYILDKNGMDVYQFD